MNHIETCQWLTREGVAHSRCQCFCHDDIPEVVNPADPRPAPQPTAPAPPEPWRALLDAAPPAVEPVLPSVEEPRIDREALRQAIYEISVAHDWANTEDTEDRTDEIADAYEGLRATRLSGVQKP